MKLHKQTRLKALITALTTGLFVLFLGLIRAQPQISAEASPVVASTLDYGSFFVSAGGGGAQTDTSSPGPVATPRPHARTHAS
jgi:hypothetical protein